MSILSPPDTPSIPKILIQNKNDSNEFDSILFKLHNTLELNEADIQQFNQTPESLVQIYMPIISHLLSILIKQSNSIVRNIHHYTLSLLLVRFSSFIDVSKSNLNTQLFDLLKSKNGISQTLFWQCTAQQYLKDQGWAWQFYLSKLPTNQTLELLAQSLSICATQVKQFKERGKKLECLRGLVKSEKMGLEAFLPVKMFFEDALVCNGVIASNHILYTLLKCVFINTLHQITRRVCSF